MTSSGDSYRVIETRPVYTGRVFSVRVDTVQMSDGTSARRDVVSHPGAVGVLALDERGRVVTVTQYRHPVGRRLVEVPAGLLDVDGESALEGAKRELAEEAGLVADEWHVLLDLHPTPGMSDEAIRIYFARGLHEVDSGFVAEHEEIELTVDRRPLAELVEAALAGELTNAAAVAGVLAASRVVELGLEGPSPPGLAALRPADGPWPARPGR